MGVEKMSVSFDLELGEAIRSSAAGEGRSVSAWLGAAARPRRAGAAGAVAPLPPTPAPADGVDAHLVLLARDHDTVVTSDPDDLRVLLRATKCAARTLRC